MVLAEFRLRFPFRFVIGLGDGSQVFGLVRVSCGHLRLRLKRGVHRVVRKNEEERFFLVLGEEVDRHVGEAIRQVRALGVAVEVRHVRDGVIRILVGRKVRARLAGFVDREHVIEALRIWEELSAS